MASPSDGEDEVFEETRDLTWDQETQLLASPRVGESSDTEGEDGHVMARPASHGGEAGPPRAQEESWMNQSTREALDLPFEERPAPESTSPHPTGVLDSAGEQLPRGRDAGVQEVAPLHSGVHTPVSGKTAPASGGSTTPASSSTTPASGGTTPASGGKAPASNGGTTPANGSTAPASGGKAPV